MRAARHLCGGALASICHHQTRAQGPHKRRRQRTERGSSASTAGLEAPGAGLAALGGAFQRSDRLLDALHDAPRWRLGREARGARDDVLARIEERADVQRCVDELRVQAQPDASGRMPHPRCRLRVGQEITAEGAVSAGQDLYRGMCAPGRHSCGCQEPRTTSPLRSLCWSSYAWMLSASHPAHARQQ